MKLEAPMVVRAFGAHHALVIRTNQIAVSFIAIEAQGLRVQRLLVPAFLREYQPFSKYSPREMAKRLLGFSKLHGASKEAHRWLTQFVEGKTMTEESESWEGQETQEGQDDEPKAAKTGKRGPRKVGVIYKALRNPIEGEKLSPQAEVILSVIKDAGDEGIKRGDLIMNLSSALTTRQPAERVLAFYQPKLVAASLISVIG